MIESPESKKFEEELLLIHTSWYSQYMDNAIEAKENSGCLRRQVGANLVTTQTFIASHCSKSWTEDFEHIVWNRPPPGKPTCKERGECLLDAGNGRPGCVNCNHAEIVAIIDAGINYNLYPNSELYITLKPCLGCLRALAEAKVSKVYYLSEVNEKISPETDCLVDGIILVEIPKEYFIV